MMFMLIMLVVGAGVSASKPGKPEEPLRCGPNSHFERCSKICPPQNCSSLIDPLWLCENPGCKPECRCNDGYVRDDRTGLCISRDECLAQCGPLERFVKDSPESQRTCANYMVTGPQSLCKPFTGCVCGEGRVRLNDNATGACVLPKDCPRRQCPLHEHFENCPSVCVNETCISKNPDYKCLLPAIPLPCKPRCICDKEYLRNHLGQCIPENHCPIKRCPINEVWRCASMCPQDSCKRLEPGFKCPPGIISVCIPVCACKDGYLRNDRGLCIPRELCPASLRCGINEVAVECQAYLPQTCESVYTLYRPIENPPCIPGCDCRSGYLRNKRNICIPSQFCPTVPQNKCGPNQIYKTCGSSCEPSCADLDTPSQVCPAVCVEGCFCKEGYLKDDHGNCVPRSQCPLPVCYKPNEVAKDCGSYCEMRTCEDYNRTDIVCPAVCVRGCFCRKGYVRNAYGVCIRPEKCPPKPVCLQEHEEYQSCGSSCPDNCDNYMNTDRICTLNCVAGCNCKKGYVRNLQDNTCIRPEQCPSKECTGENEELNLCASYCPVTCANRFTQGDWACITLCREACDCIPGTLRNDSGVCVSVEKCTPPVCRQNEKYMKCGTACPLTCDNYKKPPPCTRQCVEDCFCEDGYVRDRFMRCVKPENCEPICPAGEKFNECSAHCQDTCENYNVTNRICTYQCQSGCVCEEGTVRRKDGQCVLPSKCTDTITCPSDEIYDPCSAHCEPTCEHHGPDRVCTAICKPGCRCGDEHVRRKDGKCVKMEECPTPQCPDNEVYDPCPPINCPPGKACAQVCTPTCRCADGQVRCKDGRCAKPENCQTSTSECPDNEVYDPCPPINCPPGKACAQVCTPTCRCADGMVRCKDGRCAKPENCQTSTPECPDDEVYDPCPPINCPPGKACAQVCMPTCRCADGLVRCKDGRCAKPENCQTSTPECPDDEVYDPCPPINCPPGKACAQVCMPTCRCADGLVRCKDGRCAKPENCQTSTPECPDGEVYDPCPPINCPPGKACAQVCTPTCRCADGLVRCKDGRCAKPKNCQTSTPECPDDEVYDPCPPFNCPPGKACAQVCTPTCRCADGLVRCKDGRCAKPENCQTTAPCNGDLYAEKVKCPNPCPATCAKPTTAVCSKACLTEGCQCRSGFVLNPEGKCVRPENCPVNDTTTTTEAPSSENSTAVGQAGDQHATTVASSTAECPDDEVYDPCPPINCPPGKSCAQVCTPTCRCADGLVRCKDGRCAKPKNCQSSISECPDDEVYDPCPPINCPPGKSCAQVCTPTCRCADGLVRCKDGRCAKPKNCQSSSSECSDDEVYDPCPPINCPPGKACAQVCTPTCRCADGLVRCKDGRCAKPENCQTLNDTTTTTELPSSENSTAAGQAGDQHATTVASTISKPCSDPNAIRKKCASHESCRATCAVPNSKVCPKICIIDGCECKKGYVLSAKGGKCVGIEDCPQGNVSCNGDPNAVIKASPAPCPSTCELPNGIPGCLKLGLDVGCECKPGYLKADDNGKCISPNDCKGGNPCGANETFSSCKSYCPYVYCPMDDRRIITPCEISYPCPGGCVCKLNYKRKSKEDDICIISSTCPAVKCSRPNEIWDPCPSECRRESCLDVNNQPTTCNTLVLNCQPQCVCKKGYFRDNKNICIPAKDCPNNKPCDDPNAERVECAPAPSCRSTCARPNPSPCILSCAVNECVCKKGYVLSSKGGKCIPVDQCPNASCNGDSNAVIKANPIPCPSTCNSPNASPWCKKYAPPVGCECKPGYLQIEDGGKCIKPEECPGGNPCGANGTFAWCKAGCPTDYCPEDDSRAIIACDPPHPCPSGCICKLNYRKKKVSDETCILASSCPPVKCTRPNEIWDPCPSECRRERCADVNNQPTTCNTLLLNCQPQCICKKGYFRNDTDICIPGKDCPNNKPCDDPNSERLECAPASSCRSTCAVPNPSPCIQICAINECVCKKGYVLSAKGGKCIPVDECPKDAPCNGDINAVIKVNPIPCPSTCNSPNASPWCKKYAPPVGCECKPGYLQVEDGGKCIKPEECPGGNPCGENSTFVWCKAGCPTDYCPVDDRRAIIACSPPYPCPNGCVCKINYRKKSISDDTCILASTCPSVKCTRPNEIWDPCPSACLREKCVDINNQPTTCNTLILNCQPKCICKKGYFRNDTDICIPGKDCAKNQTCSDPNAERVQCAPAVQCRPTCAMRDPGLCIKICVIDDCVCKKGFILSEKGGKCIPEDQCPNKDQCSDPNAERVECALATECRPSCAVPKPGPCISQICIKNECVCKKGYVLSEKGGKCITADQCPTKNQTCSDPNAERVQCAPAVQCRPTCAMRDPGPCIKICVIDDCVCKKGFILSEKGGKCIPEDQCPANSQCSDPNAERVECALATGCRPSCAVPNPAPCISQICIKNECVCKKGYVLSEKGGKCVTADQCPIQKSCNGDPNAQIKECPLACPATCDVPNAIPCRKACMPIGCECKDGYLLSETNGKCILPEKCKGGYACGGNETFVSCKVSCLSDYCPDGNSSNRVICETPNPCYPGCVCKFNYRRKSVDDRRCIYASECPPQKCNKNEEWSRCPSECLQEDCSNVKDPPVICNTLLLNCQPKCICKKGYYRDSNRNCIPASQCPKPIQCKANEVYRTCRIICPPQTCVSISTSYDCRDANTRCEPGCDCISEYLRNGTENDPCIPSSQCPTITPECGINEHYETNRNKCELTCKNYELESTMGPCQATSGCFCDTGYVRNSNGLCIPKKKCPKNIVCPPNEVVSECYNSCHKTCKTRLRSDGRMCQLACIETGCLCKEGFLRHDNGTCVPINECSPPRCDENETYSSCGTACAPTCQNRGDNCTACTDQCVEDCFCNKGLVRADDGTCIKPKDCPKRTCKDPNEVFDDCPPTCPPTDGCSNIWSKFNCTDAIKCCKPQCRCRPGYYRKDICVPTNQC